jgi:hypothetical protein
MDADIKNEFGVVRADLQELNTRLSADIRRVEMTLRQEIREVETTFRQEIREEGIATRCHFDVVAESLRDDIRIIAEGLIALDAKVEAVR